MKHKYYDVIVAWAEGKEIQSKGISESNWETWYGEDPQFDSTRLLWRIKPDTLKIKFRVALMKNNSYGYAEYTTRNYTLVQTNCTEIQPNEKGERWYQSCLNPETHEFFIKWITNWIELEIVSEKN